MGSQLPDCFLSKVSNQHSRGGMNSKQGAGQTGMHPTELQPQRDLIKESTNYKTHIHKPSSIESGYFGEHVS